MKNKEIDFSILDDDIEALPNDIKVSESEKERIFKMTQKMYDMKKKSADTNYENTNETSGVEVYRRPKWYRAVSFVAAFVIAAAGIGGSTLLMMNMRNNPNNISTQLEDETEPTESEELEEATETEITSELSYDMSTKEGIYNKMLNNIDFYNKVSGRFIHGLYYSATQECEVADFSVDLDTTESYLKTVVSILNNPEDVINGLPSDTVPNQGVRFAEAFIEYSDGVEYYSIVNEFKDNYSICAEPQERDRTPYTAEDIEAIKDWYYNSNEENTLTNAYYNNNVRTRHSELEFVVCTNSAYSLAINHLTNFDVWDITGEEIFANRDCVVIEGTVEKQLINNRGEASFKMYIDKETGFVVSFVSYDEAGELFNFDICEEIYFDDDAEMVFLDLDQYETVEYQEPEDPSIPKVNSNGETYGTAGGSLTQGNIDNLPDFIAIGVHGLPFEEIVGYKEPAYIRTAEFLGTFIDGEEAFIMQAEIGNVSDTAVAREINIYTKEGEFIGTRTFYSEPDNIK